MSNKQLYCPKCSNLVVVNDYVILDILNTITHKKCYDLCFAIKDYGTFEELVSKYIFLDLNSI
ncbi:hypothetical protein CFK40_15605 [Virgibacillus necropolis]|uniref:Uncharacterized protein n=1 Tax=Virgibacillus necropolis TaxID=163877 RepID=A0A221MFA1_9BACI|nr:hypothetical protein CFK40_15605 [Virgibacillus necropolis]